MFVNGIPAVTLALALNTLTTRQLVLLKKQVEREHEKLNDPSIDVEQMFDDAVVTVSRRLRTTFPHPEGTRPPIVVKIIPPREDEADLLYSTIPSPLTECAPNPPESLQEEGTLAVPYNACNKDERARLLRMGLAQGSFKLECRESVHHPEAKEMHVNALEEEKLTSLEPTAERNGRMEGAYRLRGGARHEETHHVVNACKEFECRHNAAQRTFRNRMKRILSIFWFGKREDKL